jgi:hypothetical protein
LQYRKVIPEKLRPYFGKREIKESLKSADPAIARLRHHQLSAKIESQIANAWAQYRGEIQIEESRLHHITDDWYESKLVELTDNEKLAEVVVESAIPREEGRAPVLDREHVWSLTLDTPPESNSLSQLRSVLGNEAEKLLRESEIAIKPDSELYHKLLILMADRALSIAGKVRNTEHNASSVAQQPNPSTNSNPTLGQIWEKFEHYHNSSENPRDRAKVRTYRSDFSKLIQHTGNCKISMLTRNHATSFRDALRAIPDTTIAAFKETAGIAPTDFRKLPLDQQCEIAAEKNLQVRSASGVRNALKRVAAVLAWANKEMQMDYDTFVPLPGVPNSQTENQGEAFEYNESEIKILLTEDQILQKLSVDELWCMLVLYYTGARLREITPMIGRDLLIVDGTEGLYIREDHALGRTVKNRASVRVVPLHPSLKELGFLSYAERNPQDAIFTSLWDTTGYRANKFSRKLKSLGIEHGFKPTIRPSHGFRHHVVGLWRKAEKRQDLQDAYLGHSQKSQQGRYSNFNSTAKAASEVWPELPDKDKLLSYLWPQE